MLIIYSDNIPCVDDLTKNKCDRSIQGQVVTSISKPPDSIHPKKSRPGLLDIDALELARQLTISASLLYLSVKPTECLQRSLEAHVDFNDSISTLTRNYNRVSVNHVGLSQPFIRLLQVVNFVENSIMHEKDARKADVIKYFISVAHVSFIVCWTTCSGIIVICRTAGVFTIFPAWSLLFQG